MDVWELLDSAPEYAEATADLFHWSTNYDAGRGPSTLFLDLIGWSADHLGESMFDLNEVHRTLGYLELAKLANALTEYANRPTDIEAFVNAIIEAESE